MSERFIDKESMKYFDKNGYEWSVDKGDWTGSFDKGNNLKKRFLIKISIPLLIVLILTIFLLN